MTAAARGGGGGGSGAHGVDRLLGEAPEGRVGEGERTVGSLTGRGSGAVDEREDVIAPDDAARGIGRVLDGRQRLLETLDGRERYGERGGPAGFGWGDGAECDRRGAGR